MRLGRIGIVVAAGVATLFYAVRPRDDGGGYDPYFRALNEMMKREGPARPVLLLDLDRLDQNIKVLRAVDPPAQAVPRRRQVAAVAPVAAVRLRARRHRIG